MLKPILIISIIVLYHYSNFGEGQICSLSNIKGDAANTINHGSISGSELENNGDTASIKDIMSE
jgi:hypothetical protein